jgi:hypothetical protein
VECYPVLLGVSCDGDWDCPAQFRGDFLVSEADDEATRLGYVLDHVASLGRQVAGPENPLTAETLCPARRH